MNKLKAKSINGVLWALTGRYGYLFIQFFIFIVLARLLSPKDFGLIGMTIIFFAVANVLVNSGFGVAYIQKKNVDEKDASTIFYFNLVLSIFIYLVLWFTAPIIANFYQQSILKSLIRVMGLIIIIQSFNVIQNSILVRKMDFKKRSQVLLIASLVSGILGITAAAINFGVWSLVIQKIGNGIFLALGFWIVTKWKPKIVFCMQSLKSMFSFGSFILFSSLIATIFNNIYYFIIGKFYPAAYLGFYTNAKKIQSLASEQSTDEVSRVLLPVLSKLQEDNKELKKSVQRFLNTWFFFIMPILIILIVLARPLVITLFKEKWEPMIPFLQLLCILGIIYPLHLINSRVLIAKGLSKLNFGIEFLRNALRICNILITIKLGVLYLIFGEICLSFFITVLFAFYTNRLIKFSIFEQVQGIFPVISGSLIMLIIGFIINRLFHNNYINIIIGVIVCGGSYLIFQSFFNRKQLLNILKMRSFFLKNST